MTCYRLKKLTAKESYLFLPKKLIINIWRDPKHTSIWHDHQNAWNGALTVKYY